MMSLHVVDRSYNCIAIATAIGLHWMVITYYKTTWIIFSYGLMNGKCALIPTNVSLYEYLILRTLSPFSIPFGTQTSSVFLMLLI